MSVPAFNHVRKKRFDSIEHTPEIDAKYPFPVFDARFCHRPAQIHSRIVVQDIDAPAFTVNKFRKGIHFLSLGNINLTGQYARAQSFDFPGYPGKSLFAEIRDNEIRALPGKRQSSRSSDARSRSGNDGYLIS